jgi:hypothetical protein
MTERISLADALPGLGIHPLPEGWTAKEAFLLIKVVDDEGHSTWSYRTTNAMNREELLGVLTVHKALIVGELVAEFEEEDD